MSQATEKTLAAMNAKFGGASSLGPVTVPVATTGGWSCFKPSSSLVTNAVQAVKSSAAGTLGGWNWYSDNSLKGFLQIFDVATAGAVTLNSTVPDYVIEIPPFGYDSKEFFHGIAFANGIQIAFTTTATGNTAMTTGLFGIFLFK